MDDNNLQALLAKQEITEVIYRYARALDRMDEAMLRSVFHPGSRHWHFFKGPSSDPALPSSAEEPGDFVAFALGVLSVHKRTHHQMGNSLIELRGDSCAHVETYFTALHRMRARGDPLAGAEAFDTEMDYFVGGRYLDVFELKAGRWAISQRTGMTDWTRLEAPSSQGFGAIAEATIGKRAPDDLVYSIGA